MVLFLNALLVCACVCVCVCTCVHGWMAAMLVIGSEYMLKCIFVCLCFVVSRPDVPGSM